MLVPIELEPAPLGRLNRHQYHQLCDLGVFEDRRVELLRGVVVEKTPMNPPHQRAMIWLTRILIRGLDDSYVVRPALPFVASDDSEPEPDLMVTHGEPDADPTRASLLIEISDSSLRKDRKVKLPLYAEVGVPEYWIVNVSKPGEVTVEVYTEPTATGYAREQVLRDGDILKPRFVPIEIAVADLPR